MIDNSKILMLMSFLVVFFSVIFYQSILNFLQLILMFFIINVDQNYFQLI